MIFISLALFALAIYLFILFIVKRDKGQKEPTSALFAAMGFGFLALVGAMVLNEVLLPTEIIDKVAEGGVGNESVAKLFLVAIGVGIIEESVKVLPFSFFVYKKRYFNELTDGIIYFGIIGLTFGIVEDIFYSLEFGGGVGVLRILISPYLHASFCILFGWTLIQKKLLNKSWWLVLGGFIAAVTAHGLFDFFAFLGGWWLLVVLVITIALNILLFVLFRRAQITDAAYGKSAVGINKFCRHCGKPNPEQLLYCSYCGKHS